MFLSSRKYDPGCSSRIRILIFYPSRIADPRSRGQKGTGSGSTTLVYKRRFLGFYCTPSHLFLTACPTSNEDRSRDITLRLSFLKHLSSMNKTVQPTDDNTLFLWGPEKSSLFLWSSYTVDDWKTVPNGFWAAQVLFSAKTWQTESTKLRT